MDHFKDQAQSLESPDTRLTAVVPSDTALLPFLTRAICVETAGHVSVVTANGETRRLFVAAGVPFPLRVSMVRATGTTATGIGGLA